MARIINGVVVRPRFKYPWIVPLMSEIDEEIFLCGAALISDKFILTAAHCFLDDSHTEHVCQKKGAPSYCYVDASTMRVGLLGKSHAKARIVMKIKRIIIHPDYDSEDNTDDIALAEIQGEVRCNKYASTICLPTEQMRSSDGQVTIAGWGRYYQNPDTSEHQLLREGRVKHVDPFVCQSANAKEKDRRKIFCTQGLDDGNQTSCQGDSGSSVFAAFNDVFYSLGVTSIHSDGENCPVDGAVTFANTVAYMDWISHYVKNLPSPPDTQVKLQGQMNAPPATASETQSVVALPSSVADLPPSEAAVPNGPPPQNPTAPGAA